MNLWTNSKCLEWLSSNAEQDTYIKIKQIVPKFKYKNYKIHDHKSRNTYMDLMGSFTDIKAHFIVSFNICFR